MSVDLISGPYFTKLVHLSVLSILSLGPDFIYLCPDLDFITLVRVRILVILSPDLIKAVQNMDEGESGSR